ncbi:MAG: DUF4340 domain-containing protein [Myxococcales bacterium]|nr:DUF4340 domain-containing protein [Myxococcales bacterium]
MKPRTTGILLAIALLLAGFVYLYEIRGADARREAEERAKRLFPDVEAEQIEWIALTTSDRREARLVRDAEGWALSEPVVFPADRFAVDGLASNLASLGREAEIEDPQPPAEYGLDAEARRVRFSERGTQHELRLGYQTPVGSNTYAAVGGSDAVFTVETYKARSFDKKLDDLRDKHILDFDTASIERVEVRWPGGRVILAREAAAPAAEEDAPPHWHLTAPIDARADDETVEDLLADLSFLRAKGFVDDPPSDAEAGLAPAAFEVILTPQGGEGAEPAPLRLAVGGLRDGDRLVRAAQASLYTIPADRLEDFPRELVAYRYKQLARFPITDAKRIELTFQAEGAEPVTILASRDATGWTSSPESVPADKIAQMLSELSRLRADDILADAAGAAELHGLGLSPPAARIAVFGAAPEGAAEDAAAPRLAEVHIGNFRGPDGIIARAAGDPVVYRLDYKLADSLPVSLEAFRNRFVGEAAPAPVPLGSEEAEGEGFLTPTQESP